MPFTTSRAGLAGLACLTLFATASRAAEWNGSYAADGRCYCSGTLDAAISSRIVPTPLGGQSVATVCARIGEGPGLSEFRGRFDRVVYADAQCGHGPGAGEGRAGDGEATDASCSGTMEPGGDDCRAVGPRWDLASAYAAPDRRSPFADVTVIEASFNGAPATETAAGTAAPGAAAAGPDVRIVEIGGRRWREAPPGTPERGAPGTRIILDGKVFLDVELASEADFLPPSPAAARPASRDVAPERKRAPAKVVREAPSADELKARRERLLAEARERLRERRAAEAASTDPDPAGPSETIATVDPTDEATDETPSLGAASERSSGADEVDATPPAPVPSTDTVAADGGPDVRSPEAVPADAVADAAPSSDDEAVERSAETLAGNEDGEALSPFVQALRMPPATRASSREFGYVDAMPASWEYGGGGLMLEGSAAVRGRFRALARIGAATDYQEFLLGGSWFLTPPSADRMTVVLTGGIETGRFELDGVRDGRRVGTELSDTGLYLGAASRFVVNRRFELQAGLGYSSFFDGDPTLFGGSYFHVGRQLDIVSRIEVGDNDSLGIGVRYYY